MLIIPLIILQLIIFIGLIFIFRRVLDRNVTSATQHIEELNLEYDKKEKEADKRLEEAKKKSQDMIVEAGTEAERHKSAILKEAESEKDRILKEARSASEEIMQRAERSRQRLLSELEERIAKEAISRACELVHRVFPEELKHDIHSQWTRELIGGSSDRLSRLRIPEGVQEIRIGTAFSLTDDERKDLTGKMKKLLGRDISLREETDPKIVAGLIITIGSLVLDGSLRNKIREHAEAIKNEGSAQQ